MKKKIFVAVALLTGLCANAQLLWKVSGNGAKGDSYLFGTHHLTPVSVLDDVKGLNEALGSVDAVYGELNMSEMADPSMQQLIMSHAMAPADSTLVDLMTVEQLDSLNTILGKYTDGMLTVQQVVNFKPAMVETQLAMFQTMKNFPEFSGQEQLDSEIQKRGLALGKKIGAFETLDKQLSILMGNPLEEQVAALMENVRTDEESAVIARELTDAYMSRNLPALEKIVFKASKMDEKARARIIDSRNFEWIEQLKNILPEESVFAAVGVGHLIGENGLIEQLRKIGYTVTPVDVDE